MRANQLPTRQQAEVLLEEAFTLNPGPWVAHSRHVAEAARLIAARLASLDPEKAYVLGLLHDIGRREGVYGMRHVLDGSRYLNSLGYDAAARICLTHSYPLPDVAYGSDSWDGSQAEYDYVQSFLKRTEYDLYDKLIQLSDSLALPSGFCLMEKRFVDVVLRYGFNQYTLDKWRAILAIRLEFEAAIDVSIYALLPGVVENTFA